MGRIEEYKSRIYPWVKLSIENDHATDGVTLTEDDQPVVQGWQGDLVLCYCIDEGDQFSLIQKRDLDESGFNLDDLHNLAIENLSKVEYKLSQTNFGGHGLLAGGNHEAAAICLTGVWDYLSNEFNDNLRVIIPAKDLIMFVPASKSDLYSAMLEFKDYIFENGERLLTKNVFHYDKSTKEWSVV